MNAERPKEPTDAIRAGRAFVELFKDDPSVRAGLARAQLKLRLFGAGLSALHPFLQCHQSLVGVGIAAAEAQFHKARQRAMREADRDFAVDLAKLKSEWEATYGRDCPESWHDIVRELGSTKYGTEKAIAGEYSEDVAFIWIEAERLQLKRQPGGCPSLFSDGKTPTGGDAVSAGNGDEKTGCVSDEPLSKVDSPAQFAKRLDLSNGRKFTRLFKDGKLTGEFIDNKNYRLHLRHLPATDPESPAYEPSK